MSTEVLTNELTIAKLRKFYLNVSFISKMYHHMSIAILIALRHTIARTMQTAIQKGIKCFLTAINYLLFSFKAPCRALKGSDGRIMSTSRLTDITREILAWYLFLFDYSRNVFFIVLICTVICDWEDINLSKVSVISCVKPL